MAQDTRKDPRAKVLSMTVRYKSATIDEFIEHHSHDVSRGGIFIKTPSPFPPGTLLKFEIRIQEEQSVLAGVGRVVWKREPAQASAESPAGMGVKFIKIDDKSKALISRLVENHQGKVSTFDAVKPGVEAPGAATPAAAKPAAAAAAAAPAASASAPSAAAKQAAAAGAKRAATMLGLGAIGSTPPAAPKSDPGAARVEPPRPEGGSSKPGTLLGVQSPAVAAAAGGGFFPKTDPQAEMPPPEERTVMKQAAELLQQALAEAGGSMDEVGTAPAHPDAPARDAGTADGGTAREAATNGEAARADAAGAPPQDAPVDLHRREATTVNERAMRDSKSDSGSDKPPADTSPAPKAQPKIANRPAEAATARAPATIGMDREEKGSGGKILMGLLVVAGLVVGGYVYVNRMGGLPGMTGEAKPTSAPETAAPTPAPPATAAPPVTSDTMPAVTATAEPTPSVAPSASASASAKASATPTAKPATDTPKATPTPRPKPPPPSGDSTATPAPAKPKKNADPYD